MRPRLTVGCTFVLCTLFSGACVGCIPYYGVGQKKVPRDPIAFVDAKTGKAVGTVLVIPRYSSGSGVSTGGGHGPRTSMSSQMFVAHPFLYHQGESFVPRQPKSKGMVTLWPWAFLGSGSTLDGVVVVAPGYKPQWVWNLWSPDSRDSALSPIAESEARADLERIATMINWSTLSEVDKATFSYAAGDPIHVRFTESDKKTIRSFISQALMKPSKAVESH